MPVMDDNRFFASATAPVAPVPDLTVERVVLADPALVELVVFPREGVAFGAAVLLEVEEAGFRAAAVVVAVVPTARFSVALPGDETVLGVVEVRRAAPVTLEVAVRFLSSSDTDGWLR